MVCVEEEQCRSTFLVSVETKMCATDKKQQSRGYKRNFSRGKKLVSRGTRAYKKCRMLTLDKTGRKCGIRKVVFCRTK